MGEYGCIFGTLFYFDIFRFVLLFFFFFLIQVAFYTWKEV